jgi:signal transduction histidine kinase
VLEQAGRYWQSWAGVRATQEVRLNRSGLSATELEAILDTVPARISAWDEQFRMIFANARSREVLGIPAGGGQLHLADLIGAERFERELPDYRSALGGQTHEYTISAAASGDQPRTFDVSVHPLGPVRPAAGFVFFAIDRTQRAEAEQQTRVNREQAALLEARTEIATGIDDAVIQALHRCIARLGRCEALATAERAAEIDAVTDQIDTVIRTLRETIRTLRVAFDMPVETPATRVNVVSQPADPGRTAGGEASGLSAEDLIAILDALPGVVTAWDRAYFCTFANNAALRFYGKQSRAELVGQHGSRILGAAAYQASLPIGEAAVAGIPQQFVRSIPAADGSVSYARVDYVAHRVRQRVIGAVALVLDVTDVALAAAERDASERHLTVLHDRERIAEDLHDLVIQRLFAAELLLNNPRQSDASRLATAIQTLRDAMEELEVVIYGLHTEDAELDLFLAVERVVRQSATALGFEPAITWTDRPAAVPVSVGTDVLAVLNEALSNAGRHGRANSVEVSIATSEGELRMRIADDGVGIAPTTRSSGLSNMAARAARHNGDFRHEPNQPSGTVLHWSAMLGEIA